MSAEFIEGYNGKVQRDPLAEPDREDFPFGDVFERLDGAMDLLGDLPNDVRKQVALALNKLNSQICARALSSFAPEQMIGRAYLLLNWLLNPSMFTGQDVSQAYIAKCLGVSPGALSPLCAELSKRYGVRSRFQAHDWRSRIHLKPKFEPLNAVQSPDVEDDEAPHDSRNGEYDRSGNSGRSRREVA